MKLPTLYKKTSTGKIQTWTIGVEFNPRKMPEIVTTYGQLDGKMQTSRDEIKEGKNIGKSNETSPLEQAHLEAKAQWDKKKKDKNYVEQIDRAEAGESDVIGGVDPMLAHKYKDRGKNIKWPAYAQPKLNGHRCIATIVDGVCTLWSRTRKPVTGVPHIAKALSELFPGKTVTLDGELYNHDLGKEFEKLTSLIRQDPPVPGHEQIQYHIYDRVTPNPFWAREEANFKEIPTDHPHIKLVETRTAHDEEHMLELFSDYLADGYEGLMVRNMSSSYVGKRSADLLKVKEMEDGEYKVIGVKEGQGKMVGKAIFICFVPDCKDPDPNCKHTVAVKMKGSLDSLVQYMEDPNLAIGKQLTVQFQYISAYGKPIFPVGLRLREEL